ncbi:Uma2 family endonuclease [Oscillatoria sp. FACHB-1406]|uniref:Uma2 family endonuclease n=1 Tax=Oscillatoria sp. FACHB-1406 TaxID=2692846 RepID=UPI00168A2663|nr:Uma2 family endonuclease [Oscillatoria sp. FACHB-1406]MBD2579687.1 Uma2 family endonuclease [Oscillatoria sp. FACHB-1406]
MRSLSKCNSSDLPSLKRWTVRDYHRMSELGILDPSERTELIDGQITLMIAKGTPHVTALRLLAAKLEALLVGDENVFVSTQDPILLDDLSEPEPDLVLARGTILDYSETHPCSEDIYLLVEVADSTLKTDCEIKDKLYARAGIADYWVLDVKERQLHLFRDPTATGYTRHLIVSEPNRVASLAFPHLNLSLSEILPPQA